MQRQVAFLWLMEKHEIRTGRHAEKKCHCTSSHQGLSQCKISGETDFVGGNKRTGAGFNDLLEQILQFFNRGKPLVFVLGRSSTDYAVKLLKKRSVRVFQPGLFERNLLRCYLPGYGLK